MLNWTRHDHMIGIFTAVGLRGVYCLQREGANWVLTGQGHDTLSMLAIPPEGRTFQRLELAQEWVVKLDSTKTVEPQVSGT